MNKNNKIKNSKNSSTERNKLADFFFALFGTLLLICVFDFKGEDVIVVKILEGCSVLSLIIAIIITVVSKK